MGAESSLTWNEVCEVEIAGSRIIAKDAMIMLSPDESEPEWPGVTVEPGTYVVEIHLADRWHCAKLRIAPRDSAPETGKQIGTVSVDHGKAAFIDHDSFISKVRDDPDAYEEWTAMDLDDELDLNFSGKIAFWETELAYVKSGDGDGTYPVFELMKHGEIVGLQCNFD